LPFCLSAGLQLMPSPLGQGGRDQLPARFSTLLADLSAEYHHLFQENSSLRQQLQADIDAGWRIQDEPPACMPPSSGHMHQPVALPKSGAEGDLLGSLEKIRSASPNTSGTKVHPKLAALADQRSPPGFQEVVSVDHYKQGQLSASQGSHRSPVASAGETLRPEWQSEDVKIVQDQQENKLQEEVNGVLIDSGNFKDDEKISGDLAVSTTQLLPSRSLVGIRSRSNYKGPEVDPIAKEARFKSAVARLRCRVGITHSTSKVSIVDLHNAIQSFGLYKYSVDEIVMLIKEMEHSRDHLDHDIRQSSWGDVLGRGKNMAQRATGDLSAKPAFNHWWHTKTKSGPHLESKIEDTMYTFEEFVELMFDEELERGVSTDTVRKLRTIREVLMSGDTNRMVAELTHVRIDDLAAPPAPMDFLSSIEPIVNLVIIINIVTIGVETDSRDEAWPGWYIMELCFVTFFIFEMFVRIKFAGIRQHYMGPDKVWNIFDSMIVGVSVLDLIFTKVVVNRPDYMNVTILRVIRLTRLTRMIRMFRFSLLKELTLMIKGLMGGFKTLLWATVLLIFTIYVIGVFSTTLIGRRSDIAALQTNFGMDCNKMFSTVPRSMFTLFRCFTGDCADEAGRSIPMSLSEALGTPFALAYCVCMMIVTFGIFNLIIAIYIENTLEAAKQHHDKDRQKRYRESLRIAHATKDLLKRFCIAAQALSEFCDHSGIKSEKEETKEHFISTALRTLSHVPEESYESTSISKDLFLMVIQDQTVQKLMDELDIPPGDRASLFDVLDSDGSGGLAVTELVQGLLKVRGEARRSDVIAVLLSVRTMQSMVRDLEGAMSECQDSIAKLREEAEM